MLKFDRFKFRNYIKERLPLSMFGRLFIYKSNGHFANYRRRGNFFYLQSESGLNWKTHRHRLDLYRNGFFARGSQIGTSYLLDRIEFQDDDVIIDCGANMGDLQLYFLGLSKKPKYFGFEPNLQDFACVRDNLVFEGNIFPLALWSTNEIITFFQDTKYASSSLIKPKEFTKTSQVKAVRLDSLDDFSRFKSIKLLKLEGEGAEPEIVKGASGLLNKVQYISADIGPERGVNEESTEIEVTEILNSHGFDVIYRNPYHRRTVLFKNRIAQE